MMSIKIEPFETRYETEWEEFIKNSDNGTLFHLRNFLGYHNENVFTDASLLFTSKGAIKALFPASAVFEGSKKVLYSHPGASYGGLIVEKKMGLSDIDTIVNSLTSYAGNEGFSEIVLTQTPIYYYSNASSCVDFSLYTHGFDLKKRELSSVLSLRDSYEGIYASFPESLKRSINKAAKSGLRFKQSQDVEQYYDILKKNLEMRHEVKPTHSLQELKILFDLFPERVRLYAVYLESSKMIAGIVCFLCNTRVNLAFYIAHDHAYQNLRPIDFAMNGLIKESIRAGFGYLDFGTFTLNMEPNWGLCRYKEKFGARGVFRDSYIRRIK